MIKEFFIGELSKIEPDWKRLEEGSEMTSFQTTIGLCCFSRTLKRSFSGRYFGSPCSYAILTMTEKST